MLVPRRGQLAFEAHARPRAAVLLIAHLVRVRVRVRVRGRVRVRVTVEGLDDLPLLRRRLGTHLGL